MSYEGFLDLSGALSLRISKRTLFFLKLLQDAGIINFPRDAGFLYVTGACLFTCESVFFNVDTCYVIGFVRVQDPLVRKET